MHYLYRITNRLSKKVYIGQTVDDKTRWTAHKSYSKNKPIQYIHRAIAKYGVENFIYEVIVMCLTQQDADEIEKILITQYDSRNKEKGYNISPGGDVAWNRGLPKELNPLTGVPRSEETKKKISKATIGKTMPFHTDEWKDHMSKIMTGRTLPKEQVEKIAASNRGRSHTDQSKINMSKAHIGIQAGEKHPMAKLNWEIINQIRDEYATGLVTRKELSKKYNLSKTHIRDILINKTWKI